MRSTLLTIVFLLHVHATFAQAYDGKVEYQKKDEPATLIDFPYSPSIVEDALVDRMEKMGHKKKESKGFLVFKSVVIKEISPDPMDYVMKVERKSRKDKDESVIYLIMNSTEDNVLARINPTSLGSNAKNFLNSLKPHVEAWHLEVMIKEQEEVIAKAEKKLKGLVEDKDTMEKKMKELQADLKENEKDTESQKGVLEKQKEILLDLKTKRKAA